MTSNWKTIVLSEAEQEKEAEESTLECTSGFLAFRETVQTIQEARNQFRSSLEPTCDVAARSEFRSLRSKSPSVQDSGKRRKDSETTTTATTMTRETTTAGGKRRRSRWKDNLSCSSSVWERVVPF